MKDLTAPKWIFLKGALFLLLGITSGVLLLLEYPTIKVALLWWLSVWCCCRFYYFAFYVIQHYVDPGFRFSGLGAFFVYWWSRRRKPLPPE